jgi:predicted transcriptional regulator
LFENCHAPADVTSWIDKIETEKIKTGPFKEVLEAIYHLQKTDIEPPDLSSVRYRLNETLKCDKPISKAELLSWIASLKVLIPGFISLESEKVGVQGHPDELMKAVHSAIQNVPNELQQKYLFAFCSDKDKQA